MALIKNTNKYWLGTFLLLIPIAIWFNSYKDKKWLEENTARVQAEITITQKGIEAKKLIQKQDSINAIIAKKQAVIDYLENNPQIIIQNNDKTHLSIDRLNALNSILLFSNNITRYEDNRERYSLHRFGK